MMYLKKVEEVYKEAALNPQKGLCCIITPIWQLPGLNIPSKMLEMNYAEALSNRVIYPAIQQFYMLGLAAEWSFSNFHISQEENSL